MRQGRTSCPSMRGGSRTPMGRSTWCLGISTGTGKRCSTSRRARTTTSTPAALIGNSRPASSHDAAGFVFRIRVPADFGEQELVWTLTSNGKTERAYATLIPEYFIDDLIIMANNGLGTGLDQTLQGNEAPTLQVEGGAGRTARVGQPVTLTAFVSDDDVPSPRGLPASSPGRPGAITAVGSRGLRVSWFVYRGSGRVTFDPPQTKVWADTREGANSPWAPGWSPPPLPEDGRWVVRATFANPGTYVLQCLAHDGGLMTSANVTFVVDH